MRAPYSRRLMILFSDPEVRLQFERKRRTAKMDADGGRTITIEHEGKEIVLKTYPGSVKGLR